MGVFAAVPVQLRIAAHPDRAKHEEWRLAPYAYCLLDFVADRELGVSRAEGGQLCEALSKEVTWRFSGRTNAQGLLVPWRQEGPRDPDSSVCRAEIDRTRPFLFNFGEEWNLWWASDFDSFQATRDRARAPVTREAQLYRVSTMVAHDERARFLRVFVDLNPRFSSLGVADHAGLVQAIERDVVRDPTDYRRTPVTVGFGGDVAPQLRLRDESLELALLLARQIDELDTFAERHDVPLKIASLRQLLDVLDRWDRKHGVARDGRVGFGEVEVFSREERLSGIYSRALSRLEGSLAGVAEAIREVGSRLEKIYTQAIAEARWHYPDEHYADTIIGAMAVYHAKLICETLVVKGSEATLATVLDILKGRIERAPTEAIPRFFFECTTRVRDLRKKGIDRIPSFSDRLGTVFDGLLGSMTAAPSPVLLTWAERINRVFEAMHRSDLLHSAAPEMLPPPARIELGRGSFTFTVSLQDGPSTVDVGRLLKGWNTGMQYLDRFFRRLNFMLALATALRDTTVRNVIDGARTAADFARTFARIREPLAKSLGIATLDLARVATAGGVIVSAFDATDALLQGNNIALLGQLLKGAGSLTPLFAEGGLAGLGAAALVLLGTGVVYFSEDDDDRYVKSFAARESRVWPAARSVPDDLARIRRRNDHICEGVDDFVQNAERVR